MAKPASEQAEQVRFWAPLSLAMIGILSGIGFSSLVPVLTRISADFADVPGSEIAVRSMITWVGGAMALGGPVGGVLVGRFGARRVMCVSLVLFVILGTAGVAIGDIWILLASRILFGFTLATVVVATMALLADLLAETERNRWIGYFALAGALSTMAVMPLAAALGERDWRLVFLLHLIALANLAFVLWATPRQAAPPREPRATTGRALNLPLGIFVLGVASGAVFTPIPAFLPFQLAHVGLTEPHNAAYAMMALTITSAIGSFLYGRVRRSVSAAQVFLGGFACMAIAHVLIGASTSLILVLIGMLLAGAAIGLIGPNLFAVAALGQAEHRAHRLGWARSGYYAAAVLTQIPLEPIVRLYGAAGAFYAIAIFSIFAVAAIFVGRGRLGGPVAPKT